MEDKKTKVFLSKFKLNLQYVEFSLFFKVILPVDSFCIFTDAVKSMVGVGMVAQDRPGSVPILDKGITKHCKV